MEDTVGTEETQEVEFDEAADPVVVEPFWHEGVEHFKDDNGVLYDGEGIVIGSYDNTTGDIFWEADREVEYEEVTVEVKLEPIRFYDLEAVKSLGALYEQVKNDPPTDTVGVEAFFQLLSPSLSEDTAAKLFRACDDGGGGMIDLAESFDEPYTKLGSVLKRYRHAMTKLENQPTDAVWNLRALKKPQSAVKSALKGLAIILGERPVQRELESNPLEWWKVIHVAILSDRGVIARLSHFEKDALAAEVLDECSACIEWVDANEDLNVGEIGDASAVVTALYNWTAVVVEYGRLVSPDGPESRIVRRAIMRPETPHRRTAGATAGERNPAAARFAEARSGRAAGHQRRE